MAEEEKAAVEVMGDEEEKAAVELMCDEEEKAAVKLMGAEEEKAAVELMGDEEEKAAVELMVDEKVSPQVESKTKWRRRITMQVFMVLGASLGHVGLAVVAAWPNPAIPEFQRNSTNIYGNHMSLSSWQLDMLGSMLAIGNLPGTWLWGWMVANIGRKRSLMVLILPYTLGWGLVALASNVPVLLTGRFVHGICVGATFVAASTYIIELPDMSVRGAVAMIPNFSLSFGFIITIVLGLGLRWFEIAFVGEAIIVLQFLVLFLLPESPSYLAITHREEEARAILKKLRGPEADIAGELESLQDQNKNEVEKSIFLTLRDPVILRSVAIIVSLFFIQNFCGLMVFSVNMTRIFIEAGSSLDEKVSAILVFLVQGAGNFLACLYLDRMGRKICLIFSLMVTTMCLVVMAVHHHLRDFGNLWDAELQNNTMTTVTTTEALITERTTGLPSWVPLVCLMVYMFTSSIGVGPVPAILNSEYFPKAVRSQLSGLCMAVGGLFNFAALQLFSPLQEGFGMSGLYIFYAIVSALGIAFVFFFVRETKGKAVG